MKPTRRIARVDLPRKRLLLHVSQLAELIFQLGPDANLTARARIGTLEILQNPGLHRLRSLRLPIDQIRLLVAIDFELVELVLPAFEPEDELPSFIAQ